MLGEDHTIMLCMLAWDRLEKGTLPGGRDCLPRTVLLGVHNAVTLLSQLGREVLTPKNNKWLNFSLKCEYRLLINTIQKVGWLSPARSAAIATALLVGVRRGQGWRTLVTWDLEIKIINSLCGALHQCCWPWSRSGLQQPWKKNCTLWNQSGFFFLGIILNPLLHTASVECSGFSSFACGFTECFFFFFFFIVRQHDIN